MPHTTVGVQHLGVRNHFRNREINIMSIAYANCDAAITSKSTMNLPRPEGLYTMMLYIAIFIYLRISETIITINHAHHEKD